MASSRCAHTARNTGNMMVDPFEVRMRFTTQLQHLSASVTSSQKAAHYALKYRDLDEDLHSCILEQLERNNMNNRANIMSFIEHFCEMATREDHLPYVRMIQRDIVRIVDAVVPATARSVLSVATMTELEAALKDRESEITHDLEQENGSDENPQSKNGTPRNPKASGMRLDKRQIEQRIEEDRERNKRLRESMWAVTGDYVEEAQNEQDGVSDIGEDDYSNAQEEAENRRTAIPT
ncbi:hypothetical protein N7470_005928 [Penicillium chermesinum]|nr:hypothetical protein N7470_005928 [Penicillium chermesinum]